MARGHPPPHCENTQVLREAITEDDEVNLDTLSSDSSEEEIRDLGRSFQFLIVWGKKLY